MNKARTYVLAGLGMLALSGCQDFLGNKPKGYTIPEYFEDYAKLLNHRSLHETSDPTLNFITDDLRLTSQGEVKDDQGMEVTNFNYQQRNDHEKNMYNFKHGQVLTPGNTDPLWDNAYANIYVYNTVANNILNVPDGTGQKRLAARAEALVGRAFEYLNLVNIYGKHYDKATAATDYGVPIILTEQLGDGVSYIRNSVAEIYELMENDLKEATPNLPEVPANVYHPSRSIGFAFQARMYLYMGRYEEALENANEALKLKNTLHDYKPYTTIHSTFGRIVRADNHNVTFPDDVDNEENIFQRTLNNTSSIFTSITASDDLIATYKSHLGPKGEDMRLRLFFATDSANFTMNANAGYKYFRGYSTYAPYLNLNVGFTTPEIYLIAAECEARVGDINRARELLNQLRDKRIKNNVPYTGKDTPDRISTLKLVIDERRREFALCGPARLIDLKRLNREEWFKKDIIHRINGEEWVLPANDMRYIMPVPNTILDFNPNMPQYER